MTTEKTVVLPRQRLALAALVVLGLIAIGTMLCTTVEDMRLEGDETESSDVRGGQAGNASANGSRTVGAGGASDRTDVEGSERVTAGGSADFDPDRLARLLDAGSLPEAPGETAAAVRPVPTRPGVYPTGEGPPIGERVEAPTLPVRNRPETPEQALRNVVFLQGMLEERITALEEQLAAAEARADEPTAARLRRGLVPLREQRPSVAERVGELTAALPDPDRVPDSDSGE